MKCTACGLPLSPARANANCPRCGTPVGTSAKPMGGPVGWNGNAATPMSVGALPQDGQWGQARPASAFQPPMAPAPQPVQIWGVGANGMQGPGTFSPLPPAPRRPPRKPRFGFLMAGVCVCVGGLLLVLVYFLAMGQSGDSPTASSTPTRTAATSTAAVTPSPAGSPSPAATSYPGQQYITNAQLSSVQPSASQPAAPATTFKVHTTLYVVFNINSGGQAGAICLKWYMNGQHSFDFAFPVGAHTTASYGEAMFALPGSGYVELYWASSKDCTDEMLAQHVDFTITT
ncbi:MAG TPA: hypothetical protein VIZ18_11470 [Ktedonobacteraceae bacterium]